MIKIPKKSVLNKYYKLLSILEEDYYTKVSKLEKDMEKETGIKGICFFNSDGSFIGIGNEDRTMPLQHRNLY